MRRRVAFTAVTLSLTVFAPAGIVAAQDRHQPSTGGSESAPATGRAEPRPPENTRAQPRPPEKGPAEPQSPERGRAEPRPSDRRVPESRPPVRQGAVVFVGGYFYDPFFGPYPWWPVAGYPHGYYPSFQNHAVVRVMATPPNAAVYVDGFYAGVVDDFDGFFQGLPLPPGGHEITLYLEGYRTVHRRLYLTPGSTFRLHEDMEPLPPGVASEPPALAPAIPRPPEGSYLSPRTAAPPLAPTAAAAPDTREACPMGTLTLRVQPASAEVWIDGERWVSSDGGSFVIDVPAGGHRLQVRESGYRDYSGTVDVPDGETTRLDIALMRNPL